MRKSKYLPGHVFGDLTLIAKRGSKFLVSCTCGNVVEIHMAQITHAGRDNCGCNKSSLIYFIRVGEYVKIGRTANGIESRLAVYDTHSPYDVELLRVIYADASLEKYFRDYFHIYLHKGREWFIYTDEMMTIEPPARYVSEPTIKPQETGDPDLLGL